MARKKALQKCSLEECHITLNQLKINSPIQRHIQWGRNKLDTTPLRGTFFYNNIYLTTD